MSNTSLPKKAVATQKRKPLPTRERLAEIVDGMLRLRRTYFGGIRQVIEELSSLELKKVKADARTLPTLDSNSSIIDGVELLSRILEDRIRERAELLLSKREQRRQQRKARGAKRA